MHSSVQLSYIAFSTEKGNVHECPINLHSLFDVSRERSCNAQLICIVASTEKGGVHKRPIN